MDYQDLFEVSTIVAPTETLWLTLLQPLFGDAPSFNHEWKFGQKHENDHIL